ncbi:hypothetical protein D7B24_002639 [Verticillium nonalfalfae]|uniref:Uncharacterized protein n=1 Tax=Verticillium nonalfalfae TaxID=1051616 RepID=A0A3M9XZ48_9PEZI|nr:uncharacterized protein D7B24_002639 [Verticillium nonalfalfae]RNJ52906.1 hypothetical protein D7B24_002639 [Verticillium nonalfalfae]
MKSFTILSALAGLGAVSAQATNCPAPGSTSAAGDYSCNPAHAYPEGQQCVLVNGCYFLRSKAASSTAPKPTGTSCPAPGSTSVVGDYSCNPAHTYSEGLECILVDGCYFLRPQCSSSAAPKPTGTSCPAPGSTSAAGDYSCNPAHKYPEGQQCVLVNGCYFLRSTGTPTGHPNTTIPATIPATGTKPAVLPTDHVTAGAGALSASRLSAVAGLVAAGFYMLL